MISRFARLKLSQLDDLFGLLAPFRQVAQPSRGWIREIRTALGMSTVHAASRLGMTPAGVSQLERREADGAVTLNSLRAAADALDCELVYAVIPRAGSLSAILEERARHIARTAVERVSHTMRLEDQAISEAAKREQIEELVRELLEDPRALWTSDAG